MSEIHVGDVGVSFEYTITQDDGVVLDLSDASLIQLIFYRPNIEPLIVTPFLVTDGTDGRIQYLSEAGDINVRGLWQVQVYVEIGSGAFYSKIEDFTVYRNISDVAN